MRSKPLLPKSLSPKWKVNALIDRYLGKQGDSDRHFSTFYFSDYWYAH